MKKILLTSTLALLLGLVGCNDKKADSQPKASETTQTNKTETAKTETNAELPADAPTIKILVSAIDPPFNFQDENGKVTGFEVDLMTAIAGSQGMKIEVLPHARTELFAILDKGEVDMIMGAFGKNPEREQKYAMSDSYIEAPNTIVVLEESPIKQYTDLNGKIVATESKNKFAKEEMADFKVSPKEVVETKSNYGTLTQLVNGKADAVWDDKLMAMYTAKRLPQKFRYIDLPYGNDIDLGASFVVSKTNPELHAKINAGLAEIKKNGTYDKIFNQWFGAEKTAQAPTQ